MRPPTSESAQTTLPTAPPGARNANFPTRANTWESLPPGSPKPEGSRPISQGKISRSIFEAALGQNSDKCPLSEAPLSGTPFARDAEVVKKITHRYAPHYVGLSSLNLPRPFKGSCTASSPAHGLSPRAKATPTRVTTLTTCCLPAKGSRESWHKLRCPKHLTRVKPGLKDFRVRVHSTQSLTCSSNFKHKLAVHVSMTRKADRSSDRPREFVRYFCRFSCAFQCSFLQDDRGTYAAVETGGSRSFRWKPVSSPQVFARMALICGVFGGGAFAAFRSDSEILDRPVT